MFIYILISILIVSKYLQKFSGYNVKTSIFSAAPGALGPLSGGGMGGGLGRDKESPLPSLNPINTKNSAPSKLPDMPPPRSQVPPPA